MFSKLNAHKPFLLVLSVFFIITSWPFINFPLTDGDIGHWVDWANKIALHNSFLSAESDQAHGPMLAWGSALFIKLFSLSYYSLNLFNLLCGMGLVCLMYISVQYLGKSKETALLSSVFATTNIVFVYLSRTPMYEMAATLGFFLFCISYYVYLEKKDKSLVAGMALGIFIGCMSRLIIVFGLIGCFIAIIQWIRKKSIASWIWACAYQGTLILGFSLLLYSPWLLVQHQQFPQYFLDEFIYDNLLRFLGDEKGSHYDFYGFPLSAIVGLLPFTPFILAGLSKQYLGKLKSEPLTQFLLATAVPCLVIFSLSGHTKLLRYITYIFPGFICLSAVLYTRFHTDSDYIKRCKTFFVAFIALITTLLAIYAIQFIQEAQDSVLFTASLIILMEGLIISAFYFLILKKEQFLKNHWPFLTLCAILYISFFSALSIEYKNAKFLIKVDKYIQHELNK